MGGPRLAIWLEYARHYGSRTWQGLHRNEVHVVKLMSRSSGLAKSSIAAGLGVDGIYHGDHRRLNDQQLAPLGGLHESVQQFMQWQLPPEASDLIEGIFCLVQVNAGSLREEAVEELVLALGVGRRVGDLYPGLACLPALA